MNVLKLSNLSPVISTTATTCIRPISTSLALRHNPGLKKKAKVALDQKKLQQLKKKEELRMKKAVLQTPIDPDAEPEYDWFTAERQRPAPVLTDEETETRALLNKEWARFQMKKHIEELTMSRKKVDARNAALRELKKESQFLYDEALKMDKTIFPLTLMGPTETPPIEGYLAPDFVDK